MKRQSYPRWLWQKTVNLFKAVKKALPENADTIELYTGMFLMMFGVYGPLCFRLPVSAPLASAITIVAGFLLTTHGWYRSEDC